MSTITSSATQADLTDAMVSVRHGPPSTAEAVPAYTGTVKWFDAKKGFGFILNPDGEDVFVHFSSIDGFRVLKDGERVSFEQLAGAKGLSARRVRREPVGH